MSFETMIENYGYYALFFGTCLEGESFIVAAGLAAHSGYLSLPIVCVVGTLGSFTGDQIFYYIGRSRGMSMIAKRPSWQRQAERVRGWIDRRRNLAIVGSRYAYGFRTIGPIVMGAVGIPPVAFLLWNAVGAISWALIFGIGGYFFGTALHTFFGHAKKYELWVLGGIFMIAVAFVIYHVLKARKQREADREALEAARAKELASQAQTGGQ